MAKQVVRQASFGGGEFSPRAISRVDLPQYQSGMKEISNWVPTPTGSITRRPGFKHIVTAKTLAPVVFTEQSNPKNVNLIGVVWADGLGLFVAVGWDDGTDSYILTSPDGVTWTEQAPTVAKNLDLFAVTWTGSLLVAVGENDGTEPYILTSPDGVTWTERSVASPQNFSLFAIVWSGSLLVAVGAADGTEPYILTSPDGINWTERSVASPQNFNLFGIAWSGSQFIAVGDSNGVDGSYILSSPNGIDWVEESNAGTGLVILRGIVWAEELSLWMAVGQGKIKSSPDGSTWTVAADAEVTNTLYSIVWTGNYFVTVGNAGGVDALILFSYDGSTWIEVVNPKNFSLRGIAWSGELFVTVGLVDGVNAYMLTSPGDTALRRIEPFVGSTGLPYTMEFSHLALRFIRNEAYLESSPGVPYELVTPWDSQDLTDLQFAQSNDVMYITHPNYAPRKLTRTGEQTFTITNLMDETTPAVNPNDSTYKLQDGPYQDENSTVTTLTLTNAGTGSTTLTASSALFASTDVGRVVRIKGEYVWGWGIITAFSNTTTVTIFMVKDPNIVTAVTRWALGAWSGTTGFPTAVAFYQQRLFFFNNRAGPMDGWASVIGSFEEFQPTELDDTIVPDNAVYFTIASRRMLPVEWLEPGQGLYAGTRGGVYIIDAGQGANEITPGSIRVRQASAFEAEVMQPALVGDVLVYVQQGCRLVRALAPSTASDVLSQPDLTLLSEHIGKSGFRQMKYANTPFSAMWMRRADGLLVGLTLNPVARLLAWHTHQLPGSLTGADWPQVLSMAVMPFDEHDQLWVCVRRTVDGANIETIEAMELLYDSTAVDQETALCFDSAVFYNGVATTSITGLSHLEGEEVYALADGAMQGPFTVASGAITLTTAASKVWVGLDYSSLSTLETLPIKMTEAVSATGNIAETFVEVFDTNGLNIGISEAGLAALNPTLNPTSATGMIPLVTDDRMHVLPGSSKFRPVVVIQPEKGLPATITGLTHMMDYDLV